MKFFHLGDLHFGKTMNQISLLETDQSDWVDRFLEAVDERQPDAVVIAGDVYDRRIPPPEAMQLFDRLLTELAERGKYVFVIPGNHDSAIRLSHVSGLLTDHRIYIAGEPERELVHVTVPGDPPVTFWLMPYIFPKLAADPRVLDRPELSTYDEAVRALLGVQEIDEGACNVLVAHQNVLANGTAPEHSESETVIGGVGEIDYTAFDAFDYVALGHIHNAQSVGRETVRYSGCPLYYDFSEIDRKKELTLVTVNAKDDIRVETVKIPLRHRLLQKSGTLEELLADGAVPEDKTAYYIRCILRDRHVPPRAMEQLREVYGETVTVKRELQEIAAADAGPARPGTGTGLSMEEQFARFFQEQQNELPDGVQEGLLRRILDQQDRRSGDCWSDAKQVPEEDSQELLDYLLQAETEAERL